MEYANSECSNQDVVDSKEIFSIYKTGQVARILGVSEQSVRNLLADFEPYLGPVSRAYSSGYRSFSQEQVDRLQEIINLRDSMKFTNKQTVAWLEANKKIFTNSNTAAQNHNKNEDNKLVAVNQLQELMSEMNKKIEEYSKLQENNNKLQENNNKLQENNNKLQEKNLKLLEDNKILQEDQKIMLEKLTDEMDLLKKEIQDEKNKGFFKRIFG